MPVLILNQIKTHGGIRTHSYAFKSKNPIYGLCNHQATYRNSATENPSCTVRRGVESENAVLFVFIILLSPSVTG